VTPAYRQAGFFCFFSFGGSKRKEKKIRCQVLGQLSKEKNGIRVF
jgi:hypothetical protein